MTEISKWSLKLMLYSFIISVIRHILWLTFGEMALLVALFENGIILTLGLAFLGWNNAFSSWFNKRWVYWMATLPLGVWFAYALFCNVLKTFDLTSMLF